MEKIFADSSLQSWRSSSNVLTTNKMFELPLRQKERQILHVDADAFFASVEQVINPELRGKPVLVGGSSKKFGIVSAASYEARRFGIKTGMPMYKAVQMCPKAKVVCGHFEVYRRFSRGMYRIFLNHTPEVEMASIDEGYLDLTGCEQMNGRSALDSAKAIAMEINKKLGISVSCGLSTSKTVSKVASSQNKPHKLTFVPPGKEAGFLASLDLRAIPGIGPRTCLALNRAGFYRVGDLSGISFAEVQSRLGIEGIALWKRCLGFDDSPVNSGASLPKSISKERTFYRSVNSREVCLRTLRELLRKVLKKLRGYKMKAHTVNLKIKYKDLFVNSKRPFRSEAFQVHLPISSSCDSQIFPFVKKLFLENVENEPVRLLGVGVSTLTQQYNLSLFERSNQQEKLFFAIDSVQNLYGDGSVVYGVE